MLGLVVEEEAMVALGVLALVVAVLVEGVGLVAEVVEVREEAVPLVVGNNVKRS